MTQILDLLNQPESKVLEFKANLSSLQPILKTIVAFANTAGGTLIVGVTSERAIIGIADVFKAEEKLANAIADTIFPTMLPEIEIATIDEKNLLFVKVAHWRAPFYIKKEGVPNGVYIRLGSTSRPAGPEIVAELKRSVLNLSYDQQGLSNLSAEALDYEKIRVCFRALKKSIDKNKLVSLGVLVKSNGRLIPSIGGIVLFGKQVIREEYFPGARVRCARFRTSDKAEILDRYEIEGTILDAVDEVPSFIARNTRLGAKIKKLQRKDIPEYPVIAVREILINALVHADYSISGSSIHIAIYEDRLEIQNPGMLPFGFTMQDLKAGVSRVRNRVITRVFHELKLMEEWGSGYQRVIDECDHKGYPEPEWLEQGTSMRVTFFSQKSPVFKKQKKSKFQETTERQDAILGLFMEGESYSFRSIYSSFAPKISERMFRYELAQLKKMGLLNSKGRGPSTVWEKIF